MNKQSSEWGHLEQALTELVDLKDIKERIEAGTASREDHRQYAERKDPAWAAAREALTYQPDEANPPLKSRNGRAKMAEVTITVSGPVGCAKSKLVAEICATLRAIGVPYRFGNEATRQGAEMDMHEGHVDFLALYKPTCVIYEESHAPCEHCGAPHGNTPCW